MKGQRLHIRPLVAGDSAILEDFYQGEEVSLAGVLSPPGFLAKLLGSVVAHASTVATQDNLHVEHFYVTRTLRRKRIGRGFLSELERRAAANGCKSVTTSGSSPIKKFFIDAGFVVDGETLRKTVNPIEGA